MKRIVTAGMPGTAFKQPPDTKICTLTGAVFNNGLTHITGTAWIKTANRRFQRRNHLAVKIDKKDKEMTEH